ncbi:hypothetical protein Taro_026382 [Colocasia esculenta]|uniref:Uncharacterized protein n=1 Tax=Colocasia esculenta TaxID=4460 RepID=A0A843VF20_COLES|nr:hypothetical protein [Colocasia esculenta]
MKRYLTTREKYWFAEKYRECPHTVTGEKSELLFPHLVNLPPPSCPGHLSTAESSSSPLFLAVFVPQLLKIKAVCLNLLTKVPIVEGPTSTTYQVLDTTSIKSCSCIQNSSNLKSWNAELVDPDRDRSISDRIDHGRSRPILVYSRPESALADSWAYSILFSMIALTASAHRVLFNPLIIALKWRHFITFRLGISVPQCIVSSA